MTQFDRDIFFDTLDVANNLNRIELLRVYKLDIGDEGQIDAILDRFTNVTPEEAIQIVEVFKECFGTIMICHEASYCKERAMTITDAILDSMDYYEKENQNFQDGYYMDVKSMQLLHDTFVAAGVLHADYCDIADLRKDFCKILSCCKDIDDIKHWGYELHKIKIRNAWIQEELTEYLYHPNRMDKWIAANPDKNYDEFMY